MQTYCLVWSFLGNRKCICWFRFWLLSQISAVCLHYMGFCQQIIEIWLILCNALWYQQECLRNKGVIAKSWQWSIQRRCTAHIWQVYSTDQLLILMCKQSEHREFNMGFPLICGVHKNICAVSCHFFTPICPVHSNFGMDFWKTQKSLL